MVWVNAQESCYKVIKAQYIWQDHFSITQPTPGWPTPLISLWSKPSDRLEGRARLLYLPCAAEGVHVVEDGDELPVVSRVQDVAVNFEALDHHIHHVRAQLQGYYIWPVGLSSLQRGP